MGKVIGIDLGTTNSCVAILDGKDAKIIQNAEGDRTTPSIVAFTKDGERLVGAQAKRQAATNPAATLYEIKRLIGRKFNDKETQEMKSKVPFNIVESDKGDAWVEVGGKKYSPEEVSAMILTKMKETAEAYTGSEITDAVITVPAYFNDAQRQATKDAGKIAGLNVLRIINEPTAAALAYGLNNKKEGMVAVYDLGGGTFDISVLEIGDGVFEVKATNGDTFLGGANFDQRLIDYLAEEFKNEHGVDLRDDAVSLQRLKEGAEKAKIELSGSKKTNVNLPFIYADANGPKNLDIDVTRAKFEELCDDLISRSIDTMKKALADAGLKPGDVDDVILVGGMTRMPKVAESVKSYFGKEPHKGVNPDEVVADGAAIQGGALTGEVDDILLLDVTPLSLGIETAGGVFTKLIERNTTIPTKKTEIFSTAEDNQDAVTIRVGQGEREMAAANKLLGEFNLEGIPPAPRGVPKVAVTFNITADGTLEVEAMDQATQKKQKITVQASGGLSDSEVEQMVKDAEAHADEDKKRREAVELRNDAETLASKTPRVVADMGENAPAAEKAVVETALAELKEALEGSDNEVLAEKMTTLQKAAMDLGQAFYEAQEQQQQATEEATKEEEQQPEQKKPGGDAPSP